MEKDKTRFISIFDVINESKPVVLTDSVKKASSIGFRNFSDTHLRKFNRLITERNPNNATMIGATQRCELLRFLIIIKVSEQLIDQARDRP